VLSALKILTRWSLTLFVSLVLILQSAGASLALCKLGVEESGCCGAHAVEAPSCCSAGALDTKRERGGPDAERGDCTCELFGALPTCSLTGSSENAQLHLEIGHSVSESAPCIRAELIAAICTPGCAPPTRGSAPPGRRAELMSWRL